VLLVGFAARPLECLCLGPLATPCGDLRRAHEGASCLNHRLPRRLWAQICLATCPTARGPVSESLGAADQPGLLLEGSPNSPAFAIWRAAQAAGDSSSWVSWSVFTGAGSLSTFKSASGCPVEVFGVLNPASLCSFVDTEVDPGKTGLLSTGKTETPFVSMACAAMTVLGLAVLATFGLARSSGCACVEVLVDEQCHPEFVRHHVWVLGEVSTSREHLFGSRQFSG
jgi:hypothetical protein